MELKNKVISFLGDSITEGIKMENLENRFDNIILRKCSPKRVNNYGVSGTRIAYQLVPSEKASHDLFFGGRCWRMDKESDVIVVYGGTNDYGHGDAPFGCLEDSSPVTFCGGVVYLCNVIKVLYPDAVVIFVTPAHRTDDSIPTAIGKKPLVDYVEAIKTIVPKYGFYVLDFYNNLGIDPNNESDCEKYTVDGLHFNDEGHRVMAEKIIDFIQSL